MIEELVEQHHISALAITPLDCLLVETKINELIDQRGIPVVTFNTDLPNIRRLCYVGQENLLPAVQWPELMRLVARESGTVATISAPCMYHGAYRERLKGFKEERLPPIRRFSCRRSRCRTMTEMWFTSIRSVCCRRFPS